MRYSSALFTVVFLFFLLLQSPSRADEDGSVPSDFISYTIAENKRQYLARVHDWEDDEVLAFRARKKACARGSYVIAGTGTGFRLLQFTAIGAIGSLSTSYRPRNVRPASQLPTYFLSEKFNDVIRDRRFPLTPGELSYARILMEEPIQTKTQWLRHKIETQWFLIEVSERIYDEEVAGYRNCRDGSFGPLNSKDADCLAERLREEKDRELSGATRQLIEYLSLYELELKREME